MDFFCNYCKKQYKSNYSLQRHQQSKKCLNKQQELKSETTCRYCSKIFNSSEFEHHENICENKKDFIINELNNENKTLKKELEFYKKHYESNQKHLVNIAKSKNVNIQNTSNINNSKNIINNLNIFDPNYLKEQIEIILDEKLTEEIVCRGQEGLCDLLSDFLKKSNMIMCSDKTRLFFNMKQNDGNIIKDNGNTIVKIVHPVAKIFYENICSQDYEIRNKSHFLKIWKDDKKYYEKRKKELEIEIKDYRENSFEYDKTKKYIDQCYNKVNFLSDKIEWLENINSDKEQGEYGIELYDDKLREGNYEVGNMDKDHTKFTKKLSKVI